MKPLTVSIINWYGRETIRPECETSRLLAELLKQKTLTRRDVEILKQLGYEFEVKQLEVKL